MRSLRSDWLRPLVFIAVVGLFAVSLLAQVNPDGPVAGTLGSSAGSPDFADDTLGPIEAQSSFGIQDQAITTVNWSAFLPRTSTNNTYDGTFGAGRWNTTTAGFLYAPLPEIPQGATITQVVFYMHDSNATANFTGRLCKFWTPSATGGLPDSNCDFDAASTGSPGDSAVFATTSIPVIYRGDVDSDGTVDVVSYHLSFSNGSAVDSTVRLQHVRILWRRNVSPAPATATFSDVPVGDPRHQYVEALVSAGITAGIGGGLYGVNDPLTRGQMAVFLSKALGLHWPGL